MRIVTLIPLDKSAKQVIKQHGERWEVVTREAGSLFDDEPGPWLLVLPLTEERAPAQDIRAARVDSALRWVHEFNDSSFKVAP